MAQLTADIIQKCTYSMGNSFAILHGKVIAFADETLKPRQFCTSKPCIGRFEHLMVRPSCDTPPHRLLCCCGDVGLLSVMLLDLP